MEILAQGAPTSLGKPAYGVFGSGPWNLPEPIAQWVEYSKVLPAVQERYYAGVRWVPITAGDKPTGGLSSPGARGNPASGQNRNPIRDYWAGSRGHRYHGHYVPLWADCSEDLFRPLSLRM